MPPDRVIGVDVGGTKILAGTLARDGTVGRTIEVQTPTSSQEALLVAARRVVEQLLADGAGAIGVGVPMNIDRRTGIALRAANLPLESLDLARRLRERFGLPVGLENDGNATALAEWRLGAGRGVTDLIALALGTGVGGGLVLDGRLYRGWAELGHVVVEADGPPCQGNCHGRGHLEAVASGEAAERAARALWGADADAHRLVREALAGDDARAGRARADRALPRDRDRLARRTSSSPTSSSSAAASAPLPGSSCASRRSRLRAARRSSPRTRRSASSRRRSATTPASSARGSSASRRSTGSGEVRVPEGR